ncbi:N-acetylmuramidase family protein [Caulobacter sp. SL161]|uniref:N-acetylmuramidase family protein n=1 Tax=Caulobacter sp. SL161 TaxID=2995156 RepID=UPI00227682C8|nr:N-acetylmuramidase family protein [Caulobacter sp. SL161]MCY1649058.1 N-acetylmuramidase family protein [Caulobacter sp. SL161]
MKLADFAGPALPVSDDDVRAAAKVLCVTTRHVRAVMAVESRGRGVHPETRRPIILFEPHIFARETKGRFSATHPDISYATWGGKPYLATQGQRYDQLVAAMALDETAALRSASYGLFQIMGFNHRACGHASVQSFVRDMIQGERAQLRCFALFIVANHDMHAALKASDWAGFARRYNGPGFAQHGYDQKLKAAFAQAAA